MRVLRHPLSEVSKVASVFPAHLLRHGDTGVCLFSAAFLGRNDAIHMARQDMTVTCVDVDGRRLAEMHQMYPDDWEFVTGDAWEFAEAARAQGRMWDVVSVDTFTGNATFRGLASLDLWCSIAGRVVAATVCPGSVYTVPAGWESGVMGRSEIASWLVLTRE